VINRNQLIRKADADEVPASTVERDYILWHALVAITAEDEHDQMVFKGGTALRFCYFDDYRYSADLDFSLRDGLDRAGARELIERALAKARAALELPFLQLTDEDPPRIEYVGPLGHKARALKLDLAEDELIEEAVRKPLRPLYSDQLEGRNCLVYTLEEVTAEKLRCVLQRLQCRDILDLHELLVVRGVDAEEVWPLFERKARHRGYNPAGFAERLEARTPQYKRRWDTELVDHVPGSPPHFEAILRAVKRELRAVLRERNS
jgi:predicted nucleotidyltransferase component of viral defense system